MRRAHFEAFAPICPRCRLADRGDHRLTLGAVVREDGDDVLDGSLTCPVEVCRFEYPILGGLPILVADVREHISRQVEELRASDELTGYAESVIGDCVGPDAEFNRYRLYQSSYGQTHWPEDGARPAVLDAALALAEEVRGRWLDLGCAVGRGTFELAARTGELALGCDLSVSMLRIALRIARRGELRHPVRRVGVVFDRRERAVDHPARARVDFWYADATALPFAGGVAAGVLSLNLLDSVGWPLNHLFELGRVLAPDGRAILATPYDWTAAVTPLEGWLGGHSQRAPHAGSSAAELRRILAREGRPGGAPALYIDAERDDVRWRVPMHERADVEYRLDMVRLRRASI